MIVCFAKAFTSYSWSQSAGFSGLGDLVARRNTRAQVSSLGDLMDVARFRPRLEELEASADIEPEDKEAVSTFLEAWRQNEERGYD